MWITILANAGLIAFADRITKALVANRLAPGQSIRVIPGLRIRHVEHITQLRHSAVDAAGLLAVCASVLAALVWVSYHGYFQHPAARIGLGAALGGAASNLFDRQRRGAITDFFDLGWWPVFNVADIGITAGAIAALCFMRS